jgi:hypothetical protein
MWSIAKIVEIFLLMIDIAIPLLINKLLKWRKINKHIKRVRGHKEIFIILLLQ